MRKLVVFLVSHPKLHGTSAKYCMKESWILRKRAVKEEFTDVAQVRRKLD
jgi:hypothetical protein